MANFPAEGLDEPVGRDPNRYLFSSTWRLDASADAVYAALLDVAAYPEWWPEVRSAREFEDGSGELRCRSMLPYDLVFVITREIEDADARILRAHVTGDLIGTSQWTIAPDGTGCTAVFDEDVEVGKAAVRAAGRLVRPALRFNHDRMMRSGEAGLRRYLATSRPRSGR
jgi:ribosome-associated toxin RatA of RatAB toxin-antitoxin module